MNVKKQQGSQSLDFSGGLVDLECFLAWSERIKLDMSKSNPLLYEVLGRLASSKHPIAGGESFKAESAEASFQQASYRARLTNTVVKTKKKKRESFK